MKLLENKTFFTKTNNWYAPTCEFNEKQRDKKNVKRAASRFFVCGRAGSAVYS